MNKNLKNISLVLLTVFSLSACQDSAWDNHYNSGSGTNENLYQVMSANGNFSKFLAVVKSTGMDSVLTSAQTYTVWAPTDESMTSYSVDTNAKEQFVKNHISRYIYGVEDLVDTSDVKIGMLNGKYNDFTKDDGYMLSSSKLSGVNILASNGVVHAMSSVIPFYYNLYEKIKNTADMDSLSKYISSFDTETFNADASTNIGQNSYGQAVYDSVFDYSSYWMKKYGYIYMEDSTYTMLVPTNTAYQKAMEIMSPCFRTFGEMSADNSSTGRSLIIKRTYNVGDTECDSLQNAHVHQMIANDLVFRKRLSPLTVAYDSLTNTAGNVIHHPAAMFAGSTKVNASNGYAYVTDEWNLDPADTWNQEIRIETEKSTHLQLYTTTPTTYSASSTSFKDLVSNESFLEVGNSATSASMQPQIIFDVPGTLASRYNVYVVFAPITARDASGVADSTRVRFYLNYVHEDGNMYEDPVISVNPETGASFITNGNAMTKMLVAKNFKFPYANINMSVNNKLVTVTQPTTVKLRIQTNVSSSETTLLKKIMRIDCIILEPVKE